MKNDAVKAVVVLTLFSIIVMVVLAGINTVTEPRIEINEYNKMMESLDGLIPEVTRDDYVQVTDLTGYPESVQNVFVDKEGRGTAVIFVVKTQYSKGDMKYSVGFDAEGKIISVNQISYMESKSFKDYYKGFAGLDSAGSAAVEVFGGVTYSSNAFKSGLADAFVALGLANNK